MIGADREPGGRGPPVLDRANRVERAGTIVGEQLHDQAAQVRKCMTCTGCAGPGRWSATGPPRAARRTR